MATEDNDEVSVPQLPTYARVDVPQPWFANGMVSQLMAGELFNWITRGGTLYSFCQQDGAPTVAVVQRWLTMDAEFAAMYREARRIGHESMLEETLQIADSRNITDGMDIAQRKLQIETRFKLLEKLDPERYGDRKQVGGGPAVQVVVVTGVPQPEEQKPKITATEVTDGGS